MDLWDKWYNNRDRPGRNAKEARECLIVLADKKVIIESIDQEEEIDKIINALYQNFKE